MNWKRDLLSEKRFVHVVVASVAAGADLLGNVLADFPVAVCDCLLGEHVVAGDIVEVAGGGGLHKL